MENNKADAIRIQTSILNAAEKKVLVWLAQRQPRWMTSGILNFLINNLLIFRKKKPKPVSFK